LRLPPSALPRGFFEAASFEADSFEAGASCKAASLEASFEAALWPPGCPCLGGFILSGLSPLRLVVLGWLIWAVRRLPHLRLPCSRPPSLRLPRSSCLLRDCLKAASSEAASFTDSSCFEADDAIRSRQSCTLRLLRGSFLRGCLVQSEATCVEAHAAALLDATSFRAASRGCLPLSRPVRGCLARGRLICTLVPVADAKRFSTLRT
jgi:hypothetical protein